MHSSRASLAKRTADVSAMFDGVARRYDLLNDLLSLGQDRSWRRETLAALAPWEGERILDLAAGTGTSSAPFAAAGAYVVPADLSMGMLRVGKQQQPHLDFVNGDALALPFPESTFDAVTISYGLRNVEHTVPALAEMLRVTRPGGRLVVAEFSTPANAALRGVYQHGALRGVPILAAISSNPAAYSYLAESILAWPDQAGLAELMVEAGWRDVAWRNLTGGIVAIHRAWKP
ncbi:MAG: demethylmenaquinone methyltransferase [Arachnia sp.]